MAFSGRISVLVSKDLQTLLSAVRELPKEVNAVIRLHTKRASLPIWQESVRGHVADRMQSRVLGETARVSVSDSNVKLLSGGVGSMSNGTPKSELAHGTEFGASETAVAVVRSRRGKAFTRHTKRQFNLPRSKGYVVYPAARDSIPRLASLWVQTAIRTIYEILEKRGGAG